ncbi:unnamed protein product [Adineta steineri]|uniref:FAD-binding domain-containing protein n=1 Tax=Adineta steineri TaxID=433720 RepID=A0A815BBY8_9BILA|nr:unnamed protein product [Adineta steineri]CAF1621526.1 unnamed protein product [Adineta steineri]
MTQSSIKHVLIIGGGPTGLLLAGLLRDQNVPVTVIEKRREMTRTRCVKLLERILSYNTVSDELYLFSESQLEERRKAIKSMKPKLFKIIANWLEITTPLQHIQETLANYYTSADDQIRFSDQYDFSKNLDILDYHPNTIVIDCTGYHSVLRNLILPNNRVDRFIEYVLICTFIYEDRYICNELCKYYKNQNTKKFQIIPAIDDTYTTGERQTHVTCLITIETPLYKQLSKIGRITYDYLKENQNEIYDDLNTFFSNLSTGNLNKIHFDTMEFICIPLQVYRARKFTHTVNNNDLNQHWVLMGDAAMGGPYFQSISMGFESAIYFAYLFKNTNGNTQDMLKLYEEYVDRLWLTLQIRTREIQRNKQILQALCANDTPGILNKIRTY